MTANRQLDIFDNLDLEHAYSCLYSLRLGEAISFFKIALNAPCPDSEQIYNAIDICTYWEPRLQPMDFYSLPDSRKRQKYFSDFLNDFRAYEFLKETKEFQSVLLQFLFNKIYLEEELSKETVETLSDLLMEHKKHQAASQLLKKFVKEKTSEHAFFYRLGQAQWLGDYKTDALKSYVRALLYFPETNFLERIESKNLQNLIHKYGPELTPAYAWLYCKIPFLEIGEDVEPINEKHALALQSYVLLHKAENARWESSPDMIDCRKELMQQNAELYAAYFSFLQKKKR